MIEPSQLADVWYLKFGNGWVVRDGLDKDWKEIANTLMKNNYLRYEISQWGKNSVTEILKLKGD